MLERRDAEVQGARMLTLLSISPDWLSVPPPPARGARSRRHFRALELFEMLRPFRSQRRLIGQ
jgi:hypothetical protein